MPGVPVLMDEPRRLSALRRCRVLDSPPSAELDGITRAAATLCEVPIALISLVDADRQWFKSSVGLTISETPRDIAFCAHAILHPAELTVVEDARLDPRFRDNPLVTGSPRIRFYAGQPLISKDNFALGTLCVIDYKPRTLTSAQAGALEQLAGTVSVLLERQLQHELLDERDRERAAKLRESEERFRDFVESAVDYCWATDASMRYTYFDKRIDKFVGIAAADILGMNRMAIIKRHWRISPDELRAHLDDISDHRSFRNVELQWEMPNGEIKPLVVTGKPVLDDDGVFQGYRGTIRDISELRHVEEELRLRQDELAHAARFAAMGGMVFGLAHEVNQPLAAAVTFAEAGAQLLKPGNERPAAARDAFRQVASQIHRAGDIVQRLRSFVRSGETRCDQ